LKAGWSADFVVLSGDIMKSPLKEIPTTRVEQTWLAGKQVFQQQG